jgi:hypothetical protein
MRQRNLLTAIRLLAVIIATYAVAPSLAQKANVPIKQDFVALAQPKVIEVLPLISDGYRQERQDFQERLYESDGSCVRPAG